MTAEGRIQSAARWIRGANGLMASAVGKTDVGYDKSRWQRRSSWQPPEDVRDSMLTSHDDTRPAQQTTLSEQDSGTAPAGAGLPDQPAPETPPPIGDPPPNPETPPGPARGAAAEQDQSQQRSGQER